MFVHNITVHVISKYISDSYVYKIDKLLFYLQNLTQIQDKTEIHLVQKQWDCLSCLFIICLTFVHKN